MSNISSQFPLAGLSSRQNSLPDFHSSRYVKEQSFNSRESLDTGLVIQTKEGDQVTLTSNSFSQMDAFMYSSKGVVQTESGTAVFSQSQREITLASGQSFSFSVEGDLSEDELEDIEAILKGLDEVISEMTQGDMQGAVDKALELGDFDSVSSFAADMHYQRSYEMISEVATTTTHVLPVNEDVPEPKSLSTPAPELSPENHKSQGEKNRANLDFDQFFRKMLRQLEAHEEKQVGLAKNPIDKLFKHHLDEIRENDDETGSIYSALETTMDNVNSLIDEMVGKVFEDQLAAFENE